MLLVHLVHAVFLTAAQDDGTDVTDPSLTGRVVDPSGRGVPGARVRLFEQVGDHAFWLDSAPDTTCDDQGCFEIPMPDTGFGVVPVATARAMFQRTRETAKDGRDLVLRLEPAGSIDVSWRKPEGVAWSAITPRVTLALGGSVVAQADGLGPQATIVRRREDGIRFEGLEPGPYRVELGSLTAIALTIPVVVVWPGELTRHARLTQIDLAQLGPVHTLRFVDEDGRCPQPQALPMFRVCVPDPLFPQYIDLHPGADGNYHLWRTGGPELVQVRSSDHQHLRIHVDSDRTVRLTPVLRVRLKLFGPPPQLPSGLVLAAFLEPIGASPAWHRTNDRMGKIDARGEASLVVRTPGRYCLRWVVGRNAIGLEERKLVRFDPLVLDLEPQRSELAFDVSLSEDLRRAITVAAESIERDAP